jgi:Zn-dependent protease
MVAFNIRAQTAKRTAVCGKISRHDGNGIDEEGCAAATNEKRICDVHLARHAHESMKASWKIAVLAGIELRLHITFPILLIWVGFSYYALRGNWSDVTAGILFILALFSIVVLHELGHALAARRYGIGTRDITLLPIGGVARLERIPEDPKQELVVALAGPAVNVAIAAALYGILSVVGRLGPVEELGLLGGSFLVKLFWVNVIMILFNMLPAFPMDGGRVLRAGLAMRMPYAKATRIAASIGQGMAWVLGIVGLFYNPFLIIIALFVWIGASQEAGMARMRSSLGGVNVRDVMVTEFHTLHPADPLSLAVEHVLAGFQQDFPVVENDTPVGVLTRAALLKGIARLGQQARVAEVMQRDFMVALPGEEVESLLPRLGEESRRPILVLRGDELIGLLNSENLGEFFMIQAALQEAQTGRAAQRAP